MKLTAICFLLGAVAAIPCARAAEITPTAADIEAALRARMEKPAGRSGPRTSVQINAIKIGSGARANEQDKIDGVPPEAFVTVARVDFTVRTYYKDTTKVLRRVRQCKVFKDQLDEWRVMLNAAIGTDESTDEPPAK